MVDICYKCYIYPIISVNKNKKQRMMVRQAVLKGKDPLKLIEDMEIIDKMEYNPMEPATLNEKVLKDKRKKLKETFDRILKMYEREEPETVMDMKRAYVEYESRRVQLQVHFEQVMNAQRVQLDAIPLPDAPTDQAMMSALPMPGDIPLPSMLPDQSNVKSILKTGAKIGFSGVKFSVGPSPSASNPMRMRAWNRKPPGPPPGLPPSLSDDSSDESGDETYTKDELGRDRRKIRFQDDDTHNPEEPEKDSRTMYKRAAKLLATHSDIPLPPGLEEVERPEDAEDYSESRQPPGPPPGLPPMMFRGPPQMRLPPGPPPGRPPGLPPGPPPGLPPNLRPPPRLPPGVAPRMMRPPGIRAPSGPPGMLNPNILSAPPSISRPPQKLDNKEHVIKKSKGATIEAKPRIKKLGDVTKFMPVSLRVKRYTKETTSRSQRPISRGDGVPVSGRQPVVATKTKDDAYDQFMKEMENLF